jgi:HD-like signal output (HDOD) protein
MSLSPESLVNKSLELVSPPSTYSELDKLIRDPNSSIDDMSQIINTDAALTTRLLKVVNSPFYGFPSQISTITRAVTIIGTRELTHLVLATSVIDAFKGIPDSLIKMSDFWRHSLACAIAAKHLAKLCGQQATERHFIAGLLNNIGCLVLYQSMPELAREILNSARYGHEVIFEAEKRLLSFDHTDIGTALVNAWRLPNSLSEVVKYHHTPSMADEFPVEVAIVHVADVLVSGAQFGHAGDQHVPPLDPQAWELLGLDLMDIPTVLDKVNEQLDALASVLTA